MGLLELSVSGLMIGLALGLWLSWLTSSQRREARKKRDGNPHR